MKTEVSKTVLQKRVGQKLKEFRKKMKLTQQELANQIGISRPYYADVEMGRYLPSLKVLTKLSLFLKLDLNFLKENDGNNVDLQQTKTPAIA